MSWLNYGYAYVVPYKDFMISILPTCRAYQSAELLLNT